MQALTLTRATVLFSRHYDDRHLGLSKFNHHRCFVSIHPLAPTPLLASKRHCLNLASFVAKAADSTQPSSVTTSSNKTLVSDDEFTLAKVSFGVIGLSLGVSLLSYGFGAYFNILPGSEWSALMLTYGFPLAIIGMALKYAELKPVPCLTYSDAQSLREMCATPILKQVRNDVTRFRYGDEQHLDEALKRIFQFGLGSGSDLRVLNSNPECAFFLKAWDSWEFYLLRLSPEWVIWQGVSNDSKKERKCIVQKGGGIPRRSAPILQMIREEVTKMVNTVWSWYLRQKH